MIQKIIKVGNSYAFTIPKGFVDIVGITSNSLVDVQPNSSKGKIIADFKPEEKVENIVDPQVYKVAKDLLKRYLPAFKELAQK